MQSGLDILLNSPIFGLCLSSSGPGNKNCECEALKGEGQSFLSTLMGVAGDKNIVQSKGFSLPQLGKSGSINKILESNQLGIELQEGELDLNENFLLPSAFEELVADSSAAVENNMNRDLSINQGRLIPTKAYRLDSDKLEAVISTGEISPSGKIQLAHLLKILDSIISTPEGKAHINNLVRDSSVEQTILISGKVSGLDFEKLEPEISKGETNSSEKTYLADFLKALKALSSNLGGKAPINNLVYDSSMEQTILISGKVSGLDFEKLEPEISKGGTNSSEKMYLADLLKSLGVELTDSEKTDQISGQESGKKTINGGEKPQIIGKIVLESEAQEVEITKDLGKGKAFEGETPKLKYAPQNTKGLIIESGSLDKDFINSHSDRTGSDRGQDALPLSNNQPSAKVSSGIGQTEQIESFQKQFQAEVLTQIVKKASLNLKHGHTEIKIELKPEFLGHIRMHVASENQQVMVRMLTELPMVKEIIENNIYQLKADLQNQGLEVDKFEVFVSRDSEQFIGGQGNTESQEMRPQSEDREEVEEMPSEEVEETVQLIEKYSGVTLIGVFA